METRVLKFLLVPILASFLHKSKASNILFFHLAASASHRNSIWPLAEKLADKGHNITYFITLPPDKRMGSHPQIEELTSSTMLQFLNKNQFTDMDINLKLNGTIQDVAKNLFPITFDLCEAFYKSPEILEWMQRPGLHYDLVMIDTSLGDCAYGLVHKFKAKHILFAPAIAPYTWDGFGIVPESASIPPSAVLYGKTVKPSEMTVVGRFWSTLEPLIWRLGQMYYINRLEKLLRERVNMSDLPSLLEFERNTSLVLINAHFVEEYPFALPPMFQSYAGLACSKAIRKERKPLPEVLEKFVGGNSNETEGFVYISFGSVVDVTKMPTQLLNIFFEAFAAFPKLRFLWRWGGTLPKDIPDNAMLQNWFPQQDLLAHAKIKAFVTQTGRPSSHEALCFGVPMITIPIWADQDYNADRLEFIGAAVNLDILNLSRESFIKAINDVACTDKYSIRMAELSRIFRDRPVDPLDNSLFWTEYVLRHNESLLTLMKPLAMNLLWYQRRLLDVYLLFIAIILGACTVMLIIGKFTIRLIFNKTLRN